MRWLVALLQVVSDRMSQVNRDAVIRSAVRRAESPEEAAAIAYDQTVGDVLAALDRCPFLTEPELSAVASWLEVQHDRATAKSF